jgi:hypothetical protein
LSKRKDLTTAHMRFYGAKDLVCKDRFIMSDLQRNEGCACLGRSTVVVVQNAIV